MNDINILIEYLDKTLPDARCALIFSNPFECLCAVMLSAQTTDKSVNLVTPTLFAKYPDAKAMSTASLEDIESIIKSIGLYHNKAKNLLALSKAIASDFHNEVPLKKEDLVKLPGVGIKTTNVVLAECAGVPAIAVDTHVARVSKRLGFAKEKDEPVEIERKLERRVPRDHQIKFHHQMIWFGRLTCHAIKPDCDNCGLSPTCPYLKKISSKTGK